MQSRKATLAAASLLLTSLAPAHAPAQTAAYPVKPVRVICPFPAGGGLDIILRAMTQKMSENMKAGFVIEIRAGANGMIGTEIGAKAAPDGYTLLSGTTGTVTINPSTQPKMPFDVLRDIAPITNMGEAPFLLVSHPSLAARNARELIALAKSRPNDLRVPNIMKPVRRRRHQSRGCAAVLAKRRHPDDTRGVQGQPADAGGHHGRACDYGV